MDDSRAYLQQHFETFQRTGQSIESGALSIVDGGPRMKNALHHLSLFLELKDEVWVETAEWVFANMGDTQGAEFEAWLALADFVTDRMPEHLRNQPRS